MSEYGKRTGKGVPRDVRLTMGRLLDKCGLDIDRSTLHRKMHGDLPMSVDEAKAIGAALGVKVRVRLDVSLSGRAA